MSARDDGAPRPLRIGVVGGGSWGSALAALLAGKGHEAPLWCHDPEIARAIERTRENPHLPGIRLPDGVRATTDLPEAVGGADVILSAVPSQFVRETIGRAAPHVPEGALVVSASKGIEEGTLLRMDEVLRELLPETTMRRFCVLSGPSFAGEVARGAPTAVVVAGRTEEVAAEAQRIFQTSTFRVYTNTDVAGVELGGAAKNVIALAAGMAHGLGFGHNTTAALVTRGLAEITRLGVAIGARRATFYGLAGMGDLVLTCTGPASRNRTVGTRLGRGEALEDILADMDAVAEGVRNSASVFELARREGVEMPITEEVHGIVHRGRSPLEALTALLERDPKPEEWS